MGPERPLVYLLREPSSSDPYESALARRGFAVRFLPVLAFHFINQEQLIEALARPQNYGGLILTSPRAAEALAQGFAAISDKKPLWMAKPAYVVGPATAEKTRSLGFSVIGQDSGDAERLAEQIESSRPDRPLLFLSGDRRREVLPERLKQASIPVEERCVYETHLRDALDVPDGEQPDWVVFFSPSGVEAVRNAGITFQASARIAAIGSTTAQAACEAGWAPGAVAAEPSPQALADALAAVSQGNPPAQS
jgi:uroporphyrinogen-III synthase